MADTNQLNNNPQATGSPWDDDVVVPEVSQKAAPTIIGTLEPNNNSAQAVPFNVPENIEEKVGQKVPAENYITPKSELPVQSILPPVQPQTPPMPAPEFPVAATATAAPAFPNQAAIGLSPQPMVGASPLKTNFFKNLFSRKPKINNQPNPVSNMPPVSAVPGNLPSGQVGAVTPADGKRHFDFKFLQNQKLIIILGVFAFLSFIVSLTELGLISIGAEKVYGAIGIEKLWGGLPANPENAFIGSAVRMQKHPSFKIKGSMTLSIDTSIKSPITSPLFSLISKNSLAQRDTNVSSSVAAIKTATSSDIYDMYDIGSTSSSSSDSSTSSADLSSGDTLNDTTDTSSDGSSDSSTGSSDTSSDSSTGSSDTSSDSSTGSSSTDSSLSTGIDSNGATNSGAAETSNVQEVTATVLSKASKDGMSAEITPSNTSQSTAIELMLKDGDFLVKSNDIKFAQNADSDKWLSYTLDKIKGKVIQSDIFNIGSDSGFSIKGKREGNEKVGNTRCYKYKIDSMEIGNALNNMGITSDMAQNISGEIWIGINDKLIRKVNLKIITPISSSVSTINVNLEFYDYDVENKLNFPDSSEIITPAGSSVDSTAPASTPASTGTTDSTTNTAADRDTKRKQDVKSILDAMKKYKDANGSYPISKDLLKLNAGGNIIEKALVPKYLSALPTDPTDGWYYAYKSNTGSNCSVSARMENAADVEGQVIGGVLLYLKYNDN